MMHIIDPVIYPVKLYLIVVDSYDDVVDVPQLRFMKSNITVSVSISRGFDACVFDEVAEDRTTGCIGFVLVLHKECVAPTVVHECYHVGDEIFRYISESKPVFGEPMAYLLEFFFHEVSKILNSKRNEK